MYTFVCEDSIDGVFSGIYEAWAGKWERSGLHMRTGGIGNYELFMEYKQIEKNIQLAQKVASTVRRRFGEEAYERICYCLWSCGEDKAEAVYQMIRYGLEHSCGSSLVNHLTYPPIQRVYELFRTTWNEVHHYLGFLRFVRLENGILYAEIRPKNHVLESLAVHFTDRLPGDAWVIQDTGKGCAAVHPASGDWFLTGDENLKELLEVPWDKQEAEFREMWKLFCQSVSIEARKNLKLQQQNLPLRFRETMVK